MAFSSAEPGSLDRQSRLTLRIPAETRDFFIFAAWCCVTFVQFPGDQLVLYPLALYYAWAVVRDQVKILALMRRAWLLFLFPVWCLISPLWAVDPTAALKLAIYLCLTILICFQVVTTMSPRRIVHAVLLATGTIGVINLMYAVGTGDLTTGIFTQKNSMGKNMVVMFIVASAVMLDHGSSRMVRTAAAIIAGIAVFMAFMSQSATAVLLIAACGLLNIAGTVFLAGGFLQAGRLAAVCLLFSIIAGLGAVILPNLEASPVEAVLNHFGKDSTLTGRTVLWEYAEDQIAEHPYLGVGGGGFWRWRDSPLVQQIYVEFHKRPSDYFNFHNSHYEIAVHQGLIGLVLVWIAMIWATWQILRAALTVATMPLVYFFTHALAVLVRTTTEADFLKPFVLFHMVFWIGALVAMIHYREATARKWRMKTISLQWNLRRGRYRSSS